MSSTNQSKIIYGILAIIKNNDRILLIKRNKPPYQDYYGLIGGKIELGETIQEATLREVEEETGLHVNFKKIDGFLNETLWKNNNPVMHFILAICQVETNVIKVSESVEGSLKWFTSEELSKSKSVIIPSDYKIITERNLNPDTFLIEAKVDITTKEKLISFILL